MVDTCGSSGVQQICDVLSYLLGEFSSYFFLYSPPVVFVLRLSVLWNGGTHIV
jgi:hypothetical protein